MPPLTLPTSPHTPLPLTLHDAPTPRLSITVRVVGIPSNVFDGSENVTFVVDTIPVLENTPKNSSSVSPGKVEGGYLLSQDIEVTFYHCSSGNLWNDSASNGNEGCHFCTNVVMGEIDVRHVGRRAV